MTMGMWVMGKLGWFAAGSRDTVSA
jgi:hypothetical protein